jgi:uncharacterized SAM-binding protein YcdF (DUF218 family)
MLLHAIASFLTRPLLLATGIALISLAIRLTGRRRLAVGFACTAVAIIYLGALSPLADMLLAPLERRYPPLSPGADAHGAAFIVVLGSGYFPWGSAPITAELDNEGVPRIVEGVRLARIYHIPLIASGGASAGAAPPALGYARLARDLGVDGHDLLVSANGSDTHTEVLAVVRQVDSKPFIVVTSASHIPRAMALFRGQGANPLPAPTAQHVFSGRPLGFSSWLPSTIGLRKTEIALHEYLGLLAMRLGMN